METLNFQQAMNRLEKIVEELNRPDLPLEKAMDLFKEGLSLSRQCEQQLNSFENELNRLIVDEQS